MTTGNLRVVLSLSGRDDGAARLIQRTAAELEQINRRKAMLASKNRPYAMLNMRSERDIRREITQTQAAYRALAQSGRASHNDLARAAAATRQRVAELNNELNQGVQVQGKWGARLNKLGQAGAAVTAGGMAAYGVLKPAMDDQRQLQSNMAQVARNAFIADGNKSPQWVATEGKEQVHALANEWIQQSGGTTDAALGFMNAQLAQGLSFDEIRADKGRGYAGMTAMAQNGNYDFDGTASLYAVFKNAGLSGDKLTRAVEKTIQSGLDGKFEIADVVREAPALLSGMGKAGMTADKDLDYMLAWMQSAANKAGSNDEAANNLNNLINKSASVDLSNKVKKELGLNWEKEKLAGIGNGENAIQVLARLINTNLDNDKTYQAFLERAKVGDVNAANQAEARRMGLAARVTGDIQAGNGLVAAMDVAQMQKYMQSTQGTGNNKIDRINAARMQDDGAIQEKNQSLALLRQDKLMNPLNSLQTQLSTFTAEFPNVTTALQALAAAAAAAALAQGAMGVLGKGGGLLGSVGTAVGTAGRSALLGTVGRFGAVGAVVAAGGIGLMDANDRINRNENKGFFEGGLNSRAAGYAESALSGAAAGAMIGSIVPVVGTAVGAGVGAVVGGISAFVADKWKEQPQAKNANSSAVPAQQVPQNAVNSALVKPTEPPEKLTPVITQQTTTYQTALAAQTASFQAALQADTAAVSGKLDAINGTLGGLNQTIQLNSTLNLDGRIIANEVSRHAVSMFGRGAGQ